MKNSSLVRIISFLNQEIGSQKIDSRIVSLFLKQLSLLLNSGISLDQALKIIENQNLDKKLSKNLKLVIDKLDDGYDIYDAFNFTGQAFNPLTKAFIKSGNESGNLGEILGQLSLYQTEDSKNKSKIKQALIYPIILAVVTFFVVIAMLVFVLPTFISVFENANQVLPLSTRILLSLSKFVSDYGIFFILLALILFGLIIIIRKNYENKLKIDKFLFYLKPFKKFRMLNIEYQISSLLYILRKGDIELTESMNIISEAFKNVYLKEKLDRVNKNLTLGKTLSESFRQEDIFSDLFISMIEVGEDSANLVESLESASKYYAQEYIYRLSRISELAEPFMILFMAIIVGFVVFSVAIPMFDSVNNLNY